MICCMYSTVETRFGRSTMCSMLCCRQIFVRREFCLNPSLFSLTVLPVHTVMWECQKLSQRSVGKKFASSPFDTKDAVVNFHCHWLQGPKCKQTQMTEHFALIKCLKRAFNLYLVMRRFAPSIFVG